MSPSLSPAPAAWGPRLATYPTPPLGPRRPLPASPPPAARTPCADSGTRGPARPRTNLAEAAAPAGRGARGTGRPGSGSSPRPGGTGARRPAAWSRARGDAGSRGRDAGLGVRRELAAPSSRDRTVRTDSAVGTAGPRAPAARRLGESPGGGAPRAPAPPRPRARSRPRTTAPTGTAGEVRAKRRASAAARRGARRGRRSDGLGAAPGCPPGRPRSGRGPRSRGRSAPATPAALSLPRRAPAPGRGHMPGDAPGEVREPRRTQPGPLGARLGRWGRGQPGSGPRARAALTSRPPPASPEVFTFEKWRRRLQVPEWRGGREGLGPRGPPAEPIQAEGMPRLRSLPPYPTDGSKIIPPGGRVPIGFALRL